MTRCARATLRDAAAAATRLLRAMLSMPMLYMLDADAAHARCASLLRDYYERNML